MIADIQRKFIIGDEWLYFKLYSGIGLQDKLLKGALFDIVCELYERHLIDKFFFVRYQDNGGHHLRLRFHLTRIEGLLAIVDSMNRGLKQMVNSRAISRLIVDTYSRELERYHPTNISDVETLFSISTWTILNCWKGGYFVGTDYWIGGIKVMEELLEDLELSARERHELYERAYRLNFKKMGHSKETKELLKQKYRANKRKLELICSEQQYLLTSAHIKVQRKDAIIAIKERISHLDGDLTFDKLLINLIHMILNRYFSHDQNTYETVIYYMMSNFYKSKAILEDKMDAFKNLSV